MMKSSSIFFILIFIGVSQSHSHENEELSSPIDEIIRKHYIRSTTEFKTVSTRSKLKQFIQGSPDITEITKKHECIHDEIMFNLKPQIDSIPIIEEEKNFNERNTERDGSSGTQPMRFYIDATLLQGQSDSRACFANNQVVYLDGTTSYFCTPADILSTDLSNFIGNFLMPTLVDIFDSFINIIPTPGNLTFNANTYNGFGGQCVAPSIGVSIPSSYVNPGVPNADYAVFVSARPSASPNTVAYALPCNWIPGQVNSRPLGGTINFSPRWFQRFLAPYSLFDFNGAVKIAVHELTHALGFTSSWYTSYINRATGVRHLPSATRSDLYTGSAPSGATYSMSIGKIMTPYVLQYARNHFNCSTLDGVELEEFGGSGTAGSHWEKRVTGNEYMGGYVNPLMPISGLTLALFVDRGWYDVDFSMAEYWGWGKDLGCSFLSDRCENSWPNFPGYWCASTTTSNDCTPDRVAKGTCRTTIYSSNLDPFYQHFVNPQEGGSNSATNYCPYYEGTSSAFCSDSSRVGNAAIGEQYGGLSKCFPYTRNNLNDSGCFDTRCNGSLLEVNVGGQWFSCPPSGGNISTSVINGTVNCPPATLFCRIISVNVPPFATTGFLTTSPLTTAGITSAGVTTSPLTQVTSGSLSTGDPQLTTGNEIEITTGIEVAGTTGRASLASGSSSGESGARSALIALIITGVILVVIVGAMIFFFLWRFVYRSRTPQFEFSEPANSESSYTEMEEQKQAKHPEKKVEKTDHTEKIETKVAQKETRAKSVEEEDHQYALRLIEQETMRTKERRSEAEEKLVKPESTPQDQDFQFAMGLVQDEIRRATIAPENPPKTYEPSDSSTVKSSAPAPPPRSNDQPVLEKSESEDLAARLM